MGDLTINPSAIEDVAKAKKVELVGAIDAASINNLTSFVDRLYDDGTRWFLVDMRGIKYVNSTGLGSLVKYADQFTSRGGGMVLYALPPKVKVIIKMLGLDSFFPIVNSLEDALDEVRKGSENGASAPSAEVEVAVEPEPVKVQKDETEAPARTAEPKGASVSEGTVTLSKETFEAMLEEQRRTNRLLKAVILELRQLRAEFEEE